MDDNRRHLIYVGYDLKNARYDIAVSGTDHNHSYFKNVAHIDHLEDAELFIKALSSLYDEVLKKEDNRQADGWISVNDRLPEPWATVLAYGETREYEVVMYDADINGWQCESGCDSLENRPWWMPLPEPPKSAYRYTQLMD